MASTRDLRRRIRSVKNTAQITKAMQMVSATKMRKAQNLALFARPYNQTLIEVLHHIAQRLKDYTHPLLSENESKKVGVLVISTDKGLCGALNTNTIKALQNSELLNKKVEELDFYTLGKKGRDFIARTKRNLVGDFENKEKLQINEIVQIRKILVDEFLKGNLGEVYILYPHFVSTLRQEPRMLKILPIDGSLLESTLSVIPAQAGIQEKIGSRVRPGMTITEDGQDFVYEPNLTELLEFALVHLLDTVIYQAVLETKASEHSARMMTMQSATDNALELVDDLTLTYNQLRQENITRELLEITSAGAALE